MQGADPGSACLSAIEQNVGTWPPTIIAFGADEMFRDAIRLLAGRLDAAGVAITAIEATGMFHVYPIVMPWHPTARASMQEVHSFVSMHLVGPAVR